MKPYDQNILTFEAMFIGYVEALNRFEAAAKSRDPIAAAVPVFEALNWAVAGPARSQQRLRPGTRSGGAHILRLGEPIARPGRSCLDDLVPAGENWTR